MDSEGNLEHCHRFEGIHSHPPKVGPAADAYLSHCLAHIQDTVSNRNNKHFFLDIININDCILFSS